MAWLRPLEGLFPKACVLKRFPKGFRRSRTDSEEPIANNEAEDTRAERPEILE
jgi:hypothetical protein